MANLYRGEVAACFDGKPYTLCLTLGALAELEEQMGDEGLFDLLDRFAAGRIRSSDIVHILGAGLRGGGHNIRDEELALMPIDGGAAAAIRLAAKLLRVSFAFAVDASDPAEKRDDNNTAMPASESARFSR